MCAKHENVRTFSIEGAKIFVDAQKIKRKLCLKLNKILMRLPTKHKSIAGNAKI